MQVAELCQDAFFCGTQYTEEDFVTQTYAILAEDAFLKSATVGDFTDANQFFP